MLHSPSPHVSISSLPPFVLFFLVFLSSFPLCHDCNFSFLYLLASTLCPHLLLSNQFLIAFLPCAVVSAHSFICLSTPCQCMCVCLCSDNEGAGWSKLAIWPNQPSLKKKTSISTHIRRLLQWAMVAVTYILWSIPQHFSFPPDLITVQFNRRIWSFTILSNVSGLFFTLPFTPFLFNPCQLCLFFCFFCLNPLDFPFKDFGYNCCQRSSKLPKILPTLQ